MNETEVKAIWLRATAVFDRNPLPADDNERAAVWMIYADALRDVDVETGKLFMDRWLANATFWPKPGDLRKWLLDQAGDELTIDGVLLELDAWLRQMYSRDNQSGLIPLAERAKTPWPAIPADLRRVVEANGGWKRLLYGINDDFVRRELKKSLESVVANRRRQVEQPGHPRFKQIEARVIGRVAAGLPAATPTLELR